MQKVRRSHAQGKNKPSLDAQISGWQQPSPKKSEKGAGGSGAHGSMSPWAHESMGPWAHESMGPWALGPLYGSIPALLFPCVATCFSWDLEIAHRHPSSMGNTLHMQPTLYQVSPIPLSGANLGTGQVLATHKGRIGPHKGIIGPEHPHIKGP